MGLWNRKGKHDLEAGSSSGRCRGSVKKEEPASPPRSSRRAPASPPHSSRRAPAPAPFTIAPRPSSERDRQYICMDVCRRYWETRTPVPWSDAHLPNGWHLSADWVPIPPVPATGCARRNEVNRHRRLLPDDLYYDHRAARAYAGARPDAHAVAFPISVATPPPRMTAEEEACLLQCVMDDSINTDGERQWDGLEEAIALSVAGDVAFPELQLAAVTGEPEEEDPPAFEQLVGQG
ncbi:hypothetical protein VPH35_091448 [Triticum aestivum]